MYVSSLEENADHFQGGAYRRSDRYVFGAQLGLRPVDAVQGILCSNHLSNVSVRSGYALKANSSVTCP